MQSLRNERTVPHTILMAAHQIRDIRRLHVIRDWGPISEPGEEKNSPPSVRPSIRGRLKVNRCGQAALKFAQAIGLRNRPVRYLHTRKPCFGGNRRAMRSGGDGKGTLMKSWDDAFTGAGRPILRSLG
jgi:hypothetical protein